MSQLSLNRTIQSRVTDQESIQKRGIFRNTENHSKKRPGSGLTSKIGNDDNASIGTVGTGGGGDFTRIRKLGLLPSYLKKETRSSVESELFTKHKKFKIAKKELVERQSNLMKDFEHLRTLKDKFKQFGGRNFKLETLELIDFTSANSNECGDGVQNIRIGDGNMLEFQQEIQRIRGKVKDCLFNLIELNSDALKHVQTLGSAELGHKIREIFSKVEDYVKSVNSEQDASMEFLLEKLIQLRVPMASDPKHNLAIREEDIVGLSKTVQNLEVQSKMLQSEIDVKNREIEYLKNKEMGHPTNRGLCSDSVTSHNDQQELLHFEILTQKETINDYRNKLNEQLKVQEISEEKIKQLVDKISQQDHQMKENLLKFENDLSEERKKYDELGRALDEMKDANSKILENNGSNFELISNQLLSAKEDMKELQFKISKRDKQIQSLKQIINSESNKAKDYDLLLLRYDDIQRHDQLRAKEMHQLKEKLTSRTDTINSQILTISDLKKQLMEQCSSRGNDKCTGPLYDEQITKFLDHERIIKKLENNKIRSNLVRDQLLARISMLEKENDDMKVQIRKFHEDFTINRFMHDEQRRKKRLTEILVKQYQK